jgi:hypothetical protein
MNFFNYIREYADHIGGQFTDYDQNRSVIIVPLESRFQTVLATKQKSPVSGKDQAMISSKICEFKSDLDLKNLLEQNGNFDFSRFVLEDGYLKVEASCLASSATEDQVREMIQEVAQLADHYELKFTGKDVF